MKIGKIIQWDMGHRVLNHRSICKGLHGHRYKAEICMEGNLIKKEGISEEQEKRCWKSRTVCSGSEYYSVFPVSPFQNLKY